MPIHHAAVSYQGENFVYNPMQPDDSGSLPFIEVAKCCFFDVASQLFPRIRFGNDGMPKRTRHKPTFRNIFLHVKDNF